MTVIQETSGDKVARQRQVLAHGLARNGGRREWREWKASQVAAVADLANRSPRMDLFEVCLDGDLDIDFGIHLPVPRWPHRGELVIAPAGVFHLHYEEDWLVEAPPGWAWLSLWMPRDPFHPNCRPALRGAICLGKLPPGTPPPEIIRLGHDTLTLQNVVLDERDPEGVLNVEACEYYRHHPEYLPLTHCGLLDPWEGANE
jgi:hypothetical protein